MLPQRGEDEATVLSLVQRSLPEHSMKLAVRAADGELTYAQLGERAERLARHLRDAGVGPGDLVGVCLQRSASLVVAALGTLRAGAAYVALDPEYPAERLAWMLQDAATAAVLTDIESAPRLGDAAPIVLGPAGQLPARPEVDDAAPLPAVGDRDLAYVVYTSGSTGLPKGVMVEHGGLLNLVRWHCAAFGLSEEDETTQISSPGFDAAAWEIWPALASGATLNVVPSELRHDPAGLRDWLVERGIAVSFLPTALAESVIALDWAQQPAPRFLLTGGEALTRRPRPGLPFTLVNNYGLSETTVVATSGTVGHEGPDRPSIGRAVTGVEIDVVDGDGRPVGAGEPGELLIGGVALARGYLNRPELTAERFVDTERGRRLRTGDRVRLSAGGEIVFLGRFDEQLNVRGFRVEPAEVAAALNGHPGVAASAVAGGDAWAGGQLIAYVVAAGAERPQETDLVRHLSVTLPPYMVPSRFVWLESLPVTAHGKVDRDALAQAGASADEGGPAEEGTEAITAALIAELIGVDAVDPQENFFLLGGHSLLGAQLIARLEERFGVEVSLRYLFDHPTAAEVAAEVDRQLPAGEPGALVAG